MSKLLPIVALLLLVATSSSHDTDSPDEKKVPYFFQLPDKDDARMCCAQCVDEKTCILYTENLNDTCTAPIDYESIGLINFPGGRMITTSHHLYNKWQLLWIENATDPVLKNRDFSWKECAWKSKVQTDDDMDRQITEILMDVVFDASHDYNVLVSLGQANCGTFNCDVTFYKKRPGESIHLTGKTVGMPIIAMIVKPGEAWERTEYDREDL